MLLGGGGVAAQEAGHVAEDEWRLGIGRRKLGGAQQQLLRAVGIALPCAQPCLWRASAT